MKIEHEKVLKLRQEGKSYKQIMQIVGCSKSQICYICGKNQKQKQKIRQQKRRKAIKSGTYIPKIMKIKTYCKLCNSITIKRRRYCEECKKHNPRKSRLKEGFLTSNITLKEAIYKKHHKSSAYALVRARARSIIKKYKIHSCQNCGYSKHIEVGHIKPIHSFSEDTKISEINNISNLVCLCPNCHWEFDNHLLKLPDGGVEPYTSTTAP